MNYNDAYNEFKKASAMVSSGEISMRDRDISSDVGGILSRRRPKARPIKTSPQETVFKYFNEMQKTLPEGEAPEASSRPKANPYTNPPSEGKQAALYSGLVDRGVPEHVAHGMVINMGDESGFRSDVEEAEPNVHGTRGKGLIQFTGDRREKYEAVNGNDWSDDKQLDFIVSELQSSENRAYKKMKATSNAGEAAAAGVRYWLRPAEEHMKAREAKYLSIGGSNGGLVSRRNTDAEL